MRTKIKASRRHQFEDGGVDRETGHAAYRDWAAAVGEGIVAELAVTVIAPTAHPTGCECHAGVWADQRSADIGHATAQAGDADRRRAVGDRAIAELAVVVETPTLRTAVGEHGARHIVAGADRCDAAT